jgi:hypothetical protein
MLKNMWLALAVSAVFTAGQVSANEVEAVQEAETVIATATAEEVAQAVALIKKANGSELSLLDMNAIETLQANRNKRGKVIKIALAIVVGGAVIGGVSYLVWAKWFKAADKDADKAEKPAAADKDAKGTAEANPEAKPEAKPEVNPEAPKRVVRKAPAKRGGK